MADNRSKLEQAFQADFVDKGTPIPEWVKALSLQAGAKINFEKLQPVAEEEEAEETEEAEEEKKSDQ